MTDQDCSQDWQWIANEIHDGLLPWVHGATMQLSAQQPAPSSEQVVLARHCLLQAAEEGRALIGYLEGLALDDNPNRVFSQRIDALLQSVQPLAAAAEQTVGLEGAWVHPPKLSARQAWGLMRIVQQAVMNAIQHAGKASILIRTSSTDQQWTIAIADSGRGFEPTQPSASQRFGMSSMRHRAHRLNANLSIDSKVGLGTCVRLDLPIV
jgi:signal transduction histidine kinase